MKAKFFFLGLCALALAACSLDEVSQVNDTNAVTFKATTATRATAVTTNTIQNFTVWAWNDTNEFMDHVTAAKQSNGTFTTSPYYFWPTGTVDFYALYPASVGYGVDNDGNELAYIGGEISIDEDDMGGTHFTYSGNVATADIQEDNIVIEACIPGSTDSQIDLCYAITKGRSSGAVPMNFRHALSQVVFKAKDINPDFVVDIAEVSVCSVNRYGKYTLNGVASTTDDISVAKEDSHGVWSGWADLTRFEAGIDAQTLDTEGTVVDITSDPLLLIPQEVEAWDPLTDASDGDLGAYIRVLCHVTEHGSTLWPNDSETGYTKEINGTQYAYIAMPVDIDWEEGYRYTYTIIFGEGLGYYPPDDPNTDLEGTPVLNIITFNVTVDEFQDAEGVDVPTDTDLSYIGVSTQAELEGAIRSGYQEIALVANITLEDHNLYFYNDCVLDLNEYTLTGVDVADDEDCTGANSVIFIYGGTLTVNGPGTITTEGFGTGTNGNGSGDTSCFWLNGGNLVINGGTYNGGSWKDTTGSDYTDSSATVYVQSGFAYIYDGTFTCGVAAAFKSDGWKTTEGYTESIINIYDAARKTDPKTGWAYVYGGEYRNFDPANNPCEGNNTDFCAEGYGTVSSTDSDGNTWFTVVKTSVTTVDELEAAIEAGASSITIAADMTLTNYETISNDMDITIEKGVTVTYAATRSGDNTWTAFYVTGGTVNFYGEGQIKYDPAGYGSSAFYSIWVSNVNAVVNVYGGTYEGHSVCVYVQKGLANIYGGIYYSTALGSSSGAYSSLNCQDTNYKNNQADIKAYGGTYYQFDPSNPNTGDAPSYVPEGYKVVRYDDVECTVANEEGDWYTVEAE